MCLTFYTKKSFGSSCEHWLCLRATAKPMVVVEMNGYKSKHCFWNIDELNKSICSYVPKIKGPIIDKK